MSTDWTVATPKAQKYWQNRAGNARGTKSRPRQRDEDVYPRGESSSYSWDFPTLPNNQEPLRDSARKSTACPKADKGKQPEIQSTLPPLAQNHRSDPTLPQNPGSDTAAPLPALRNSSRERIDSHVSQHGEPNFYDNDRERNDRKREATNALRGQKNDRSLANPCTGNDRPLFAQESQAKNPPPNVPRHGPLLFEQLQRGTWARGPPGDGSSPNPCARNDRPPITQEAQANVPQPKTGQSDASSQQLQESPANGQRNDRSSANLPTRKTGAPFTQENQVLPPPKTGQSNTSSQRLQENPASSRPNDHSSANLHIKNDRPPRTQENQATAPQQNVWLDSSKKLNWTRPAGGSSGPSCQDSGNKDNREGEATKSDRLTQKSEVSRHNDHPSHSPQVKSPTYIFPARRMDSAPQTSSSWQMCQRHKKPYRRPFLGDGSLVVIKDRESIDPKAALHGHVDFQNSEPYGHPALIIDQENHPQFGPCFVCLKITSYSEQRLWNAEWTPAKHKWCYERTPNPRRTLFVAFEDELLNTERESHDLNMPILTFKNSGARLTSYVNIERTFLLEKENAEPFRAWDVGSWVVSDASMAALLRYRSERIEDRIQGTFDQVTGAVIEEAILQPKGPKPRKIGAKFRKDRHDEFYRRNGKHEVLRYPNPWRCRTIMAA
ncbi:hypothetical protein EJ08DRAFT_698092 [Tothia fuscella]|uniref:Uncharacterized protein n=1 Tax=Tothia fuscella TaxID=1048955 RepID=A0A9P4TY69_9PEZI|nr:hypothetical protein EJ08DRAFT_698092 [Tothia fuscella]